MKKGCHYDKVSDIHSEKLRERGIRSNTCLPELLSLILKNKNLENVKESGSITVMTANESFLTNCLPTVTLPKSQKNLKIKKERIINK